MANITITRRLDDKTRFFLRAIAEHDATFGSDPNESNTLRRLITQEAERLGYTYPTNSDAPAVTETPKPARRAKAVAA